MKTLDHYNSFLNQTKKQILEVFGHEFNFYPFDIWTFVLKKNFFNRKTVLFIFFENEKVSKIEIRKMYGKINT